MDNWTRIHTTGAARTRYQEKPHYAEGLYDLTQGIYAWMVPNGSWGEANAGLIVGDGAALLIDTFWDLATTRTMLAAMESITATTPITTVINTHADGDHWWGNELISGAEFITSDASLHEMEHTKPQSMIMLGRMGQLLSTVGFIPGAGPVGHWFKNMAAPYAFEDVTPTLPTRTFSGEMTLNIGGREIQLIEVGPAHTQGDLMVYVPDAQTLFSADVLFIDSTPVMWAGPTQNWIAALDRILVLDVTIIVPGHGPITDKNGVQPVKEYLLFVQAEVEKRHQAGLSPQQAARDIAASAGFQRFAGWNSPERLMTTTHTIYRHLDGRTDHPGIPELINIMRKQALLAHQLPEAQPAIMRRR